MTSLRITLLRTLCRRWAGVDSTGGRVRQGTTRNDRVHQGTINRTGYFFLVDTLH